MKISKVIKFLSSLICLISLFVLVFSGTVSVIAQDTVVRSILFYSPNCGHCQKVITQDLPPLINEYQEKLIIVGIDVSTPQGQQLYQLACDHLNIPQTGRGVPMLLVGDQVLVGSVDIPEKFPVIIETGLSTGGIYWPDIPEIKQLLEQEFQAETETTATPTEEISPTIKVAHDPGSQIDEANSSSAENNTQSINTILEEQESQSLWFQRFQADLYGNSVSVLVLIGMLISIFYVGYVYISDKKQNIFLLPDWMIPILAIIGLFVAVYLTYVETSSAEAICGPIGDCNTVQESRYAFLFGLIPVGLLGIIGYVSMIGAWLIKTITGSKKIKNILSLAIWLMAWFGVLFSIYLTFLEPFVIGATCMWCITSAVLMTLILLTSTRSVINFLGEDMDEMVPVENK